MLQWGEQLVIAVQAQMAPQPSAEALVAAINRVEHAIQTTWPQARWVFFEPELPRGPTVRP
jgi:non-canonical (house-cleaning) NTP pyrophosphatase